MVKSRANLSIDSHVWELASYKYGGQISTLVEEYLRVLVQDSADSIESLKIELQKQEQILQKHNNQALAIKKRIDALVAAKKHMLNKEETIKKDFIRDRAESLINDF